MLNELKKYHEIGSKSDLIYFLKVIIGKNSIRIADVKTMCLHTQGHDVLNYEALIDFCCSTELAIRNVNTNEIYLVSGLRKVLNDEERILNYIISNSLDVLFRHEIFNAELFSYNSVLNLYLFNNHYLQLEYAAIRNIMINCGFLIVQRNDNERILVVAEEYEKDLSKHINRQKREMNIEQLRKQLQHNEEVGFLAENYVLEYERKRIEDDTKAVQIKRISEIDVSAGYDIVSFEDAFSCKHDRFIEVKAVSNGNGFFWSKNEMDTAKRKANQYYLYLVDLQKINCEGYIPSIIRNPIDNILDSDEWFKETQSLFIKKI